MWLRCRGCQWDLVQDFENDWGSGIEIKLADKYCMAMVRYPQRSQANQCDCVAGYKVKEEDAGYSTIKASSLCLDID